MTASNGAVFGSIVVGIDGSETAEKALAQAVKLAHAVGASLEVVSAYRPIPESRLRLERHDVPEPAQWMINERNDVDVMLRDAAETAAAAGVQAGTHGREGDPADVLLDVADEHGADLIVVGSKGMTGAKRFVLGSVPNKVSHHATCDVLIVRTG